MSKIILHNFAPAGNIRDKIKEYEHQDQRGIVCAEKGDIVLTHKEPASEFLEYLSCLGFPVKEATFLWPRTSGEKEVSVLNDSRIIGHLKDLPNNQEWEIDVYEIGDDEKLFSANVGIAIKGFSNDPSLATKAGSPF